MPFQNFRVYQADVPPSYNMWTLVNGLRNVLTHGMTFIDTRFFTGSNATLIAQHAGPPSALYTTIDLNFAHYVEFPLENTRIFGLGESLVCTFGTNETLVCNGLRWRRPRNATWTRIRMQISVALNTCALSYNGIPQIPENAHEFRISASTLSPFTSLIFGSSLTSMSQAYGDVHITYSGSPNAVYVRTDGALCVLNDAVVVSDIP